MITHIFFDMHGTMVDSQIMGACYSLERARWFAENYPGDLETWTAANDRVVADWDAYHADLNFSGENGMRDYYEAGYRIVRALFRCAGVPEPSKSEIQRLSLELPGLIPLSCDGIYADVKPIVQALDAQKYILGVATHSLTSQAHATLVGGGIREFFKGPLIGADTAEQFDKDRSFYRLAARMAQVDPSSCLVVDDFWGAIEGARHADFKTIYIRRLGSSPSIFEPKPDTTITDFTTLLEIISHM